MPHLGQLALAIALVLAIYSVGANVYGARKNRSDILQSARHALWAMAAMVALAAISLWTGFLTDNFRLVAVANHSSRSLSTFYKFAALWGGQRGSLLFWTLLLSIFTSIAAFQNRKRNPEIAPYALAVMGGVAVFFLGMLNFVTPAFATLATPPPNGADLNPLLQNYWMTIHPPSLYTGYVSATVPFAFGAGALLAGKLDDSWIRTTRRWAIFSWLFLTLGNLFGARWAYEVLGWGGYWAWDPVENAAFMPWLVMTAYLHSVMIQERKDMLKIWNLVLIGIAFSLTLFGTFITRSGLIASVHSFTQSGLGPYFLGFLLLVIALYAAALLYRVPDLRSPAQFESYLSREAAFLFNNLILVGIAFAVFWGTIFPILSDAVRGVKITVGPPFFNKVNGPLALALIFLMGVGPLIAWRRMAVKKLVRMFTTPAVLGIIAGATLFGILGLREWYVLTAGSLIGFVFGTIFAEFRRGVVARRHMVHESTPRALVNLVSKNNRRYGGYIVHIGVLLAFVGIVGSSFFKASYKQSVGPGQSFMAGPYKLKYLGLKSFSDAHEDSATARIAVFEHGRQVALMSPGRVFYKVEQQPATEVAIRSTPANDLYIVLAGIENNGFATFQVFVTPLVFWLWAGGIVMALGTVVTMWPNVRERVTIAAILRLHGEEDDMAADIPPGGD